MYYYIWKKYAISRLRKILSCYTLVRQLCEGAQQRATRKSNDAGCPAGKSLSAVNYRGNKRAPLYSRIRAECAKARHLLATGVNINVAKVSRQTEVAIRRRNYVRRRSRRRITNNPRQSDNENKSRGTEYMRAAAATAHSNKRFDKLERTSLDARHSAVIYIEMYFPSGKSRAGGAARNMSVPYVRYSYK